MSESADWQDSDLAWTPQARPALNAYRRPFERRQIAADPTAKTARSYQIVGS